ncbi:helix-turn-helix domain-containing protein [Micromonospora sp. NPDC050495]|uniref:winged helix-turn-helix transcriptional regulator n=1 Tax=Micromonospora sp. NPDC050495 TaxID=3154936 RepID=UPI0033C7053B
METVDWRSPDLVAGDCPLSRTLDIVGGKWNAMIIRELLAGPRRFTSLRAGVGPIAAKVLAERLRVLEDYDIVVRDARGGVPAHVEYRLTSRGLTLGPVLAALWRWGVADEASWRGQPPASGRAG